MFGTNPVRKKASHSSGSTLWVQSMFSTVQGEGPYAGMPAIFLRLSGCNLRCHFCDTDFESKRREMPINAIVYQIQGLATEGKKQVTKLVVITGGEPFLQNIAPLCKMLIDNGHIIQIETAGTLWVDGMEMLVTYDDVTIVCSPKTGKVHPMIAKHCVDWKYLIAEGDVDLYDGLPNKSTQVEGVDLKLYRPDPKKDHTIWLQPCEAYKVEKTLLPIDQVFSRDEMTDQKVTSSLRDLEQSQRNVTLAATLAMKHNYRISYQLHKVLGLP